MLAECVICNGFTSNKVRRNEFHVHNVKDNDLAAGYHTVADYYYYPGWHEPGSTLETIFNKERFEELPEDLQEILLAGTEVMNQLLLDELTAKNNEALRALVEDHNVELRRLPDDVLIELRRISDEVVTEMAQADEATARVYESWKFQRRRDELQRYC